MLYVNTCSFLYKDLASKSGALAARARTRAQRIFRAAKKHSSLREERFLQREQ